MNFNYNIFYSIIIFILLITSFYLIMNNFGYSNFNTHVNTNTNTNTTSTLTSTQESSTIKSLQENINNLQSQLSNIKSEILTENNQNDIDPIINFNSNPNLNSEFTGNQSGSCMSGTCSKPPPIIFDPIANYDQAKLLDPLVDPRGRTSADQIPAPQVAAQFNFPTQGVLDRYHRVGLLIALDNDPDSENISQTGNIYGPNKHKNKSKRRKNPTKNYSESKSDSDSDSSSNNSIYSKGVQIAQNHSESQGIEGFGVYSDEGPNGILELIGKKITDNWYKYFTSISKGNKIIKIVVNNRNRKELYSGDVVYITELNRWYQVQIDDMDMIEYNPYFF